MVWLVTLPKAWINIGKSEKTPGITYVAISGVNALSSCAIEAMPFDKLTNINKSSSLQYRLDEENRLDEVAAATCRNVNTPQHS